MNDPEKSQERREGPRRWEDVIFPSYRIQEPSRPAQRVPRWIERMEQNAKDFSGQVKDR